MTDEPLQSTVVNALLRDKRADRRWRNIRFLGWMFVLILYAILIFSPSASPLSGTKPTEPYVSLIRLEGVILPNTSFSAQRVIPELQHAFEDKTSKGVILLINSPGGSPVQASIIHDKIVALKARYKKRVVVVGEDALASGAYLVATAADKIYVNPDTLTGSIGVIMSGFGFVDTLKKVGATRRLFTAGTNKDRLDPFEPLNPEDVTKVSSVLEEVHQSFIADVVTGRGDRLKGDKKELFSGDFWTGETATKLGLADGTANLWEVLEQEFGVKHYRDYTTKNSILQSVFRDAATELNLHLKNETAPLRAEAY